MRVPEHQTKSYPWGWTAALAGLAVLTFALVMALVVAPAVRVRADATVTTLASATISADTAGTAPGNGAYTALTGPVLTEGVAGDVGNGVNPPVGFRSIVLHAPVGFEFRTTGTVTVSVSPTTTAGLKVDTDPLCASADASEPAVLAATDITIYVCDKSETASTITWSGIGVRPTVGTPLASANITDTGTVAWAGVHPANFGVLTEVNGAPATIVLTPPGGFSGPVLTIVGPWSAHVQDQFGNNAIGAPVNWSITSVPSGATCQQLIAPQVTTDGGGAGIATTSLKLGNLAGIYGLSVTSGAAASGNSTATATGGPGAPCAPATTPTATPTPTPIAATATAAAAATATAAAAATATAAAATSSPTPTATATPVSAAATATAAAGATATAIAATMESVTLVGGVCNPVASTYPDATPITTIANAVSPSGVLISIWKFDTATSMWRGYSPTFPQASDLTSVDRLDAIFICVSSAATLMRPLI